MRRVARGSVPGQGAEDPCERSGESQRDEVGTVVTRRRDKGPPEAHSRSPLVSVPDGRMTAEDTSRPNEVRIMT